MLQPLSPRGLASWTRTESTSLGIPKNNAEVVAAVLASPAQDVPHVPQQVSPIAPVDVPHVPEQVARIALCGFQAFTPFALPCTCFRRDGSCGADMEVTIIVLKSRPST